MTTTLPTGSSRRPLRPGVVLTAFLVVVSVAGATGWALNRSDSSPPPQATPSSSPAPIPVPVVRAVGVSSAGRIPWDHPLAVVVVAGDLKEVTATDPDGLPIVGAVVGDTWSSTTPLLPASTYRLKARVVDKAGHERTLAVNTRTSLPTNTLHAMLSPGDGKVVGVGKTAIVTLDQEVRNPADRAAVEDRLRVSTVPAVTGAWRWMSATELHYRGPTFWAKGTKIHVQVDFDRLRLSDGMWGEGARTTDFRIGARMVSTVDVATKTMTVVRDGVLLRTLKVSTGRDEFPTKGGVHLVLEKTLLKTMDSSTIGIPRNSPAGYFLKVPNSVRISYSGEFVHSAPNSVKQQGVSNVSHGCVNLSPADAEWFFSLATLGDVVDVKHAKLRPRLSDPGTSDWNIPFSQWAN